MLTGFHVVGLQTPFPLPRLPHGCHWWLAYLKLQWKRIPKPELLTETKFVLFTNHSVTLAATGDKFMEEI